MHGPGKAVSRAALVAHSRGEGGRREREREKKKKKKKKRKRERAGGKFGGDRDGRSRVGDRQPLNAGWDGGEEKEGGYGWWKKKKKRWNDDRDIGIFWEKN